MAKATKSASKNSEKTVSKSAAPKKGNPLREGTKAAQQQAPPPGNVSEEAAKGEPVSTAMGSKVQQEGEEGD